MHKNEERYQIYRENFLGALEEAAQGSWSSISYLVHKIPPLPKGTKIEKLQVMAFGGSTFHSGIHTGKEDFLEIEKTELPQLDSLQAVVDLVLQHLKPGISHLAINFAYPLRASTEHGVLDAVLIKPTKEHDFKGLVGLPVGYTVKKVLEVEHDIHLEVAVANDTVCLALSGLVEPANTIAGIVGTGENFGLFARGSEYLAPVNLECGNFSGFTALESTKSIDKNSDLPGTQLSEKEIAGGYLYQHFNYYVEKGEIQGDKIDDTKQLSEVAQNDAGDRGNAAKTIIANSAKLVAAQMAAIMDFQTKKYSPQHKYYFAMEGSLFWYGDNYLETVKAQLDKFGYKDSQLEFRDIENSYLIGAGRLFSFNH
ncbi:MAG: hexokinase family protein [Candidatus Dojkabacteria bacterium]